jgi:hypothetical protein
MPTAAKLVASLAFALTGFLAAEAFKLGMPEGMAFGPFSLVIAAVGFICGWRIAGRLAGKGFSSSIGYGLRTSVTIVFWGLLIYSTERMIQRALDMLYKGPIEAVLGIFQLMYELGLKVPTPEVLTVLIVGGVIGGLAAEWAARRWN